LSDNDVENNTLYPLGESSKLLEIPETDLLIEEPLMNKVRIWGAAAITAIPVAIQLITFINKLPVFKAIFGG
jgi:hypothetical protein